MSHEQYYDEAARRIAESGIQIKTLEEINLPDVQTLSAEGDSDFIRFRVFGNPAAAETIVFSTIPYSTDISDDSIGVRLAVQKEALGAEAALVGVQVYDRKHQPLRGEDKKLVKDGDFTPFGRRLIRTVEHFNPRDDQQVVLHGFSMGADVSTEAAHMARTNQNFGIVDIAKIGVFEPARVANRSALEVINAFSSSGKDLYENVLASDTKALLQARKIDLTQKSAERKHAMRVNLAVGKYFISDLGGNLVLLKGFSHDTTKRQLGELASSGVLMVAGRMEDSTLTPHDVFDEIEGKPNVAVVHSAGDHSAADNVVRGGGMILHTAAQKLKSE